MRYCHTDFRKVNCSILCNTISFKKFVKHLIKLLFSYSAFQLLLCHFKTLWGDYRYCKYSRNFTLPAFHLPLWLVLCFCHAEWRVPIKMQISFTSLFISFSSCCTVLKASVHLMSTCNSFFVCFMLIAKQKHLPGGLFSHYLTYIIHLLLIAVTVWDQSTTPK